MKIKDLKPEYKELAIKNQIAQGNKPNEELPLDEYHYLGGFKWNRSPEGFDFWEAVNNGESTEIPQPEKLRENEIISQSDIDKEADEYRASVNDTLVRPDIAFKAGVEWAQGRIDEKAVLPEWISVEDRLPDVGEMVLVSVTNNKAFAGYYHERGHWIIIAINSSYKADEMHQVTHWMPKTILPPIK